MGQSCPYISFENEKFVCHRTPNIECPFWSPYYDYDHCEIGLLQKKHPQISINPEQEFKGIDKIHSSSLVSAAIAGIRFLEKISLKYFPNETVPFRVRYHDYTEWQVSDMRFARDIPEVMDVVCSMLALCRRYEINDV